MDLAPFLAASATVTKAVDFVRNAVDPGNRLPKATWNLVAFGFGLLVSWISQLNAIPTNRLGTLLTGLAIGASASGFHEVFDFFSAKAKGK